MRKEIWKKEELDWIGSNLETLGPSDVQKLDGDKNKFILGRIKSIKNC